jgi:hypothetical protein
LEKTKKDYAPKHYSDLVIARVQLIVVGCVNSDVPGLCQFFLIAAGLCQLLLVVSGRY